MSTSKQRIAVIDRLRVDEGSLCRKGINQLSKVMLFKMQREEPTMPTIEELQAALAQKDQENTGLLAKSTALEAELDRLKKAVAPAEDPRDELLKSLPEPLRKFVKDSDDRAAAALSKAAELERRDELHVLRKTAEADMGHLPVMLDDMAEMLLEARGKLSKEHYEKLTTILKSASNVVAESGFFKEHGHGHIPAAQTPLGQLEAMAEQIRKAHPELTREQAFSKAMDTPEGAKLYDQSVRPKTH